MPFPTVFIAEVLPFLAVGFIAQMIDGSLGMAYGVSSSTLLLGLGVPPSAASASVHMSEVFTTAVSGIAHWRAGNVDTSIMARLILPGILGGVVGAYILTNTPGDFIRPFISLYLLWMGVLILLRAWRDQPRKNTDAPLIPLALAGGFFDAVGGGGWGPIVTTTLIARGQLPRTTIGSVNASEFFITFAESIAFLLTIGIPHVHVNIGLIVGGVLAAPLGAILCKKIPCRALMFVIGVVIIGLSIRTILLVL